MVKDGTASRIDDKAKVEEAAKFKRLLDAEWNYCVNSGLRKNMNQIKEGKLRLYLLLNIWLRNWLFTSMNKTILKLQTNASQADWRELCRMGRHKSSDSIIITLSYNTGIIYCMFIDQL